MWHLPVEFNTNSRERFIDLHIDLRLLFWGVGIGWGAARFFVRWRALVKRRADCDHSCAGGSDAANLRESSHQPEIDALLKRELGDNKNSEYPECR
jgi:hypothetical protein